MCVFTATVPFKFCQTVKLASHVLQIDHVELRVQTRNVCTYRDSLRRNIRFLYGIGTTFERVEPKSKQVFKLSVLLGWAGCGM